MTAKEIAKATDSKLSWIYDLRKQLGRLPTVEEVLQRKGKKGRPVKYKTKE